MEALSFVKFWLTNANVKPLRETKISESTMGTSTALGNPEVVEFCEGDDSLFELEISHSDLPFKTKKSKVTPVVEITSKPQSPTSQKFRAFSFKKSKSLETEKSKSMTEKSKSLNVRFRIEDEKTATSFTKTASISRSLQTNDTMSSDNSFSFSPSKRFFTLMKPTKLSSNGVSSPVTSPARNSFPSGLRNVRKQFGKSRSASPAFGGMSPVNRIDESLQVQQDGIQSAILHCKKSFHGSREASVLSRSASESSSQEKLSTSSFEESYLFSRIASDSMSEKSIDSLSSISEPWEKFTN